MYIEYNNDIDSRSALALSGMVSVGDVSSGCSTSIRIPELEDGVIDIPITQPGSFTVQLIYEPSGKQLFHGLE